MFAFIKKKCLRCQSIFWLIFTFLCSFLVLLGVNYIYHSNFLHAEQWDRLQSATDLISTSPVFEYMSHSLGDPDDPTVKDFFTFLDAFEDSTFVEGYFVFYADNKDLYLVRSADQTIPLIKEQSIPMEVMKACNSVFYTGADERVAAAERFYIIKPVVWNNTNRKFGICVYSSKGVVDENLQWFMHATSISVVIVLLINSLLLFSVISTVIFNPLKDILNTVDLFVYQTFASYFSYFKHDTNEIDHLRSSVKRLEGLFQILRAQMAGSERFRIWISNISKDKAEKMDVFSGTAEFMALCDKDTLVGNGFAWNKKQAELGELISQNKLENLYLCYMQFIDLTVDKSSFFDNLLKALQIYDIPLDKVFRISNDAFVFLFDVEEEFSIFTDWVKDKSCVRVGTAQFVPEEHFSIQDLLVESIKSELQ